MPVKLSLICDVEGCNETVSATLSSSKFFGNRDAVDEMLEAIGNPRLISFGYGVDTGARIDFTLYCSEHREEFEQNAERE